MEARRLFQPVRNGEAEPRRVGALGVNFRDGLMVKFTQRVKYAPGLLRLVRRRAEIVMELQMSAAFDFADRCVGRTLEVLVEGYEDGQYFGRSYMDAPDIDTKVYFTSEEELTPGSYVPVLITDACEYDLIGTVPHKEETT